MPAAALGCCMVTGRPALAALALAAALLCAACTGGGGGRALPHPSARAWVELAKSADRLADAGRH